MNLFVNIVLLNSLSTHLRFLSGHFVDWNSLSTLRISWEISEYFTVSYRHHKVILVLESWLLSLFWNFFDNDFLSGKFYVLTRNRIPKINYRCSKLLAIQREPNILNDFVSFCGPYRTFLLVKWTIQNLYWYT